MISKDPQFDNTQCYTFTCEVVCKAKISVWAESEEEAEKYCNFKECDEYEIYDEEIEEILDWEIEK